MQKSMFEFQRQENQMEDHKLEGNEVLCFFKLKFHLG